MSIANVGDFDGDGTVEIAVSASQDDDGGTDRGSVYILFLNTDGTVKTWSKISDTAGGFTGPLDDVDRFGVGLSRISNVVTNNTANILSPGNYTVGEFSTTGYTTTFGGDCDSEGNVEILDGQSKTCLITNTSTSYDIQITKTANVTDAQPNDLIQYNITATNVGTLPGNVTIFDYIYPIETAFKVAPSPFNHPTLNYESIGSCDPGDLVMGGGMYATGGFAMKDNRPLNSTSWAIAHGDSVNAGITEPLNGIYLQCLNTSEFTSPINFYIKHFDSPTPNTPSTGVVDVSCDSGDRVLSGGFISVTNLHPRESRPIDTSTWRFGGADTFMSPTNTPFFRVSIICADTVDSYGNYHNSFPTYLKSFADPPKTGPFTGVADLSCDAGDVVLGGGAYVSSGNQLRESRPIDVDTWRVGAADSSEVPQGTATFPGAGIVCLDASEFTTNLTLQNSSVTAGTYNGTTGMWNLGLLPGGSSESLILDVKIKNGTTGIVQNTGILFKNWSTAIDANDANNEDTATVTINVANSPPIAFDDTFTTQFETSLVNLNVLANDTDADFDPLTVVSVFSQNGGTPSINATNNGINFTPQAGFRGVHLLNYTISDGNGGFAAANVTIPVLGTNGKIAFHSGRDVNFQIYTMNSDGSGQTNISNNLSDDSGARWSPNSTKIVFESFRDGNTEIYTMNSDGSAQTRLTNNAAADFGAAWSPDGSQITFVSDRDGNHEIYTMNSDGSAQTRLTNNAAFDNSPSWSPDKQKIAFNSDMDGNTEIYTMNSDGSGLSRLTNDVAVDGDPEWSPDGTKIAFTSNRDPADSPNRNFLFRCPRSSILK